MDLLKLTEHATRVLESCERLKLDPTSEVQRRALEAALAALATPPPASPSVVIGLFNQAIALGEGVVFRIAEARRSPTPQALDAIRRAVLALRDCALELHAASLRRSSGRAGSMNVHRAEARRDLVRSMDQPPGSWRRD